MKYSIGIDFGTLSARAVLIDEKGKILAQASSLYRHGVLVNNLPCGTPLDADWALQVPKDYIDSLVETVKDVVSKSRVEPEDVVGIGLDFTSCTVMPTTADGTPLCELKEFASEPHAYAKLWKHHAAQYCADIFNEVAQKRGEDWLPLYGDRISGEWMIPKVMQIVIERPEVYEAMDRFIEAGDWVVWQLCGQEKRSACNAGYKAQWNIETGYPSKDFFKALNPKLENVVSEKLSEDIYPVGSLAGYLVEPFAKKLGLTTKTAVAVEIIDAHAAVPACGINKSGKLLMAMGTSTCHLLLSDTQKPVPGVCGVVKDGILPGYYAYESGQSCVGDHFSWFIENCLPASYIEEAKSRDISIHGLLDEKVQQLVPGESGILALDWWNGVRSPLMNFDLTGMLLGLSLSTRPEHIYRALIEATAFGTRTIIEGFEHNGVPVETLYAGGGIAQKSNIIMQIYADICNKDIYICDSAESGAVGSAILAMAGGDVSKIPNLVHEMGSAGSTVYHPIAENAEIYEQLYNEYSELTSYFGVQGNAVMQRLKKLSQSVTQKK